MKIFIIGLGNMGSAIAKSLLTEKKYKIFASSRSAQTLPKGVIKDNKYQNLSQANYVIISVKPQDIASLAEQIKGSLNKNSVLISIAAGVNLKRLKKSFRHAKIVRTMPNLGLAVGQGIAGWISEGLSAKDKLSAKKFLNKFTENFEIKKEADIDSVTAISANGPAYFFYLAQSLYEAGLNFGFSPKLARRLVEKTFSASAILQTNQDYNALIKRVRSKKGTTDASLKVFDKNHMDKLIKTAVKAGQERAKELSNG